MEHIYSIHILQRMQERGVSKHEVECILSQDVQSLVIPSKSDTDVNLILAQVREKFLMLAINRITQKLITVRPMRDNEKKLFRRYCNENQTQ
jgi:hypothetical protein